MARHFDGDLSIWCVGVELNGFGLPMKWIMELFISMLIMTIKEIY